ncbi:hypothetical protein PYCCODRAFT_1456839 [Trametes coccinea BRFM310]|uniref:DUF6534 domain-containing protein n=1 Tax=Trametes coccinea (strain BRFM310) TaxID=1353009 RepID=A0A1Y2J1C0_TRAC3|nr:hypothetical protein PYCCODRAFT_1456839 [Trametes coccinea BRFM310]
MGHHYDDNLGALLIGQMISTFLYGISTLQTYVYLIRFPRDSPELKIWVLLVWALDTANVILVCHGLYYWAWGMVGAASGHPMNTDHQSFAKRSFFASAVLNLVVAAVVQSFFIKRIHKCRSLLYASFACSLHTSVSDQLFQVHASNSLGASRIDFCLFEWLSWGRQTIFVLAHLGLGAEATVKVINTFESDSLDSLSWLAYPSALPYTLLSVVSDAFIAGTLIQLSRGRTPEWDSPRVQTLTMQTVTFAVNRCVLLTAASLARLVAFTILPWTAWFIAADFIMGKLYANSFMACLNARTFFPTPQASLRDTAIFSSVPDVSVRSNGSVVPRSYSPLPRRPSSRALSLPDLVFCKTKIKGGVAAGPSVTERDICPCMLETR